MSKETEKLVEVNGKKVNNEELKKKKEEVKEMPQADLVETQPNVYKTRLRD